MGAVRRPPVQHKGDYVFLRPTRWMGKEWKVGEPVPRKIRRYVRRRWNRLSRIGLSGHEYTERMLDFALKKFGQEAFFDPDALPVIPDDEYTPFELRALERAGYSLEQWEALDINIRQAVMDTYAPIYEHGGGGWITITMFGETTKVQGDAALAEWKAKNLGELPDE